MIDEPRLSIRRRWAQLVLAAAVAVYGVVGFPALPGSDVNYAVAQEECDAQCWAILAYLVDQGLSQQEIIDLGNSDIEPDPETPTIVPGEDGGYEIVEPGTGTYQYLRPTNTNTQPHEPQHCANGIHGANCETLLALGVDPELLEGSGGGPATFGQARDIALQACATNPQCDYDAMEEAWDAAAPSNDQDEVDRGTQASVMCEAYGGSGGPANCNPDPSDPNYADDLVELVQWMCGQGYTAGYTGNCDQITDVATAQQEYGQGNAMTQAQSWSFNASPLTCPAGWSGTYPNCVAPPLVCPSGWSGSYPSCVAPISNPPSTCPAGWTGTPPNCVPASAGVPTGLVRHVSELHSTHRPDVLRLRRRCGRRRWHRHVQGCGVTGVAADRGSHRFHA